MKSAISFILAAGAVGIGAQDIAGASSLPACGQVCISNMLAQAEQFNCQATDIPCLCRSEDFIYGIRDCSLESCASDAEEVIQYGVGFCRGQGVDIDVGGSTSGTGEGGGSGSGEGGGSGSGEGGGSGSGEGGGSGSGEGSGSGSGEAGSGSGAGNSGGAQGGSGDNTAPPPDTSTGEPTGDSGGAGGAGGAAEGTATATATVTNGDSSGGANGAGNSGDATAVATATATATETGEGGGESTSNGGGDSSGALQKTPSHVSLLVAAGILALFI